MSAKPPPVAKYDFYFVAPISLDIGRAITWAIADVPVTVSPLTRYRDVLARIDFAGFPLPYMIEAAYDARSDLAVITVSTRVRPRHAPDAPLDVLQSSRTCGFHNGDPRAFEVEVVRAVRGLLLQNLEHELDEQFYFDGRRIFDPHVLPTCTDRGGR